VNSVGKFKKVDLKNKISIWGPLNCHLTDESVTFLEVATFCEVIRVLCVTFCEIVRSSTENISRNERGKPVPQTYQSHGIAQLRV
jgi:hypothetical protein